MSQVHGQTWLDAECPRKAWESLGKEWGCEQAAVCISKASSPSPGQVCSIAPYATVSAFAPPFQQRSRVPSPGICKLCFLWDGVFVKSLDLQFCFCPAGGSV